MTISFSRNPDPIGAYTLLEVLLALGLSAILAVVSVPAIDGWFAEYAVRSDADALVKLVQEKKLLAERTGQGLVIVLLAPGESVPASVSSETILFREGPGSQWRLQHPFATGPEKGAVVRIDSRGRVEPVSFRVSCGPRFVEYRFDFLTGHAHEEASSF